MTLHPCRKVQGSVQFFRLSGVIYPRENGLQGFEPTATILSRVRKNSAPWEIAGVERQVSPRVFFAVRENWSVAGTTKSKTKHRENLIPHQTRSEDVFLDKTDGLSGS